MKTAAKSTRQVSSIGSKIPCHRSRRFSRRLLVVEARVRAQCSTRGIYGARGTMTAFSLSSPVFPLQQQQSGPTEKQTQTITLFFTMSEPKDSRFKKSQNEV